MTAPWWRRLAAVVAVLVLLAAPPRPVVAGGPVSVPRGGPGGLPLGLGRRVDGGADAGVLPFGASRRVRANDVAGTYSLFGGQASGANGCPNTLTLGSPVRVPRVPPIALLRFPGESITRDGTRCADGSLLVIRKLGLFNSGFMESLQLRDVILRVNTTELMRNWLAWSDSVGIITDSWACGSIPRWNSTNTYMLFGDDSAGIRDSKRNETIALEDGRRHVMIVDSARRSILCILRAPKPPAESPVPIVEPPTPVVEAEGSGGLSAGPVAGIAVGAAVAAVAATAAVALGYRRWAATRGGGNGDGSGGGGGGGGGGAPTLGVPAGVPAGAPGTWHASAPPTVKPAAAVPGSGAVHSPGSAPPLPPGLMYSWEAVTPSGSTAPRGGG